MRKISCFFLAGLMLCSCSGSDRESSQITIKGSDTQLPLTQQAAEEYMKKQDSISISVVGGGSGVGISALIDGNTDIAMSSRDMKTEEKLKLHVKNKKVVSIITSYDALAVIVNPENKVAKLTREQLEDIFTGKITNWKDVGGTDDKIVVYSRESSSGTYEFFKEHVMKKKNFASSVLSMPATGSIIQSISQTSGGIGYVGIAYVREGSGIKALSVSYDQGKTYVAPSIAAAKDKSYPIARPLFFFYLADKEAAVKPFVDFVLSDEGQKIVEKVGYIPLR